MCAEWREAERLSGPSLSTESSGAERLSGQESHPLVSLGEMDRRMKVAALPLARTLALARTHMLHDAEVAESDCVAWG